MRGGKIIYIFMALICCCLTAQQTLGQNPVFSQFYASPLSINPAFAGNGDADWRIMGIRRSQWIGAGVDPLNTTSLSLDGKIYRQKNNEQNYIGAGVLFLQDKGLGGAYNCNSFNFAISSHVSLDEDDRHGLSAGLGGTYSNTLIDYSQLSFGQQLSSSGFNRVLPTNEMYISDVKPYYSAFAGVTYTYRTETSSFDIGLAGYRFISSSQTALQDKNQQNPPRYNIHANYQAFINAGLVFNANALYVVENHNDIYSAGVNFGKILGSAGEEEQPTILNFGLWYRQTDAVIPYLGLSYKNMQGGLSYDVNASSSKSSLGPLQTFEFSLIFRSPQKRANPIPCPWK